MVATNHIRNPVEWGADQVTAAAQAVLRAGRVVGRLSEAPAVPVPAVRRIAIDDIRDALARGIADLGACRTDAMFLCLVYPVAGLVLARLAVGYDMLPLLFPLASGFALVGPVAAVGLYELSRRREAGLPTAPSDVFAVVRSPAFDRVAALGLVLFAIFLAWIAAAYGIYLMTLGPEAPTTIGGFLREVFTTPAGWAMIVAGMGVGLLFAVVVLVIGTVSFPMLLDRDVGVATAVATSIRAAAANPLPFTVWGMIIAGGLVIGTLPALIGLVIVMPVFGHATWHLYRKLVPAGAGE